MADSSQILYADDGFDLPRFHTHAQSHNVNYYSNDPPPQLHVAAAPAPPPPPPPMNAAAPPPSNRHLTNPRLAHLIDTNSPPGPLARSMSFNAAAPAGPGRSRHHPDDLERALGSDPARQPHQMSFYPSAVAYHQPTTAATSLPLTPSSQPYDNRDGALQPPSQQSPPQQPQQEYYQPPRRANTQIDPNSSRQPLSPRKTGSQSQPMPAQANPRASPAAYPQATSSISYSSASNAAAAAASAVTVAYPTEYKTPIDQTPSLYPKPASPYAPPQSSAHYATTYTGPITKMEDPSPPTLSHSPYLPVAAPPRGTSHSTPNTPVSYTSPLQQQQAQAQQQQYYPSGLDQQQPMAIEQQQTPQLQQPPPPKRRAAGFKRVRDARDLRPYVNPQPQGRRIDPNTNIYISPIRALTTHISQTYNLCNPNFRYEQVNNPRRVLTKPSKPAHNDGYDNDDYDYILYVNDVLGSEDGHKYLILDILGQGTFGQVVKCQNVKTNETVAVKVVKNKPAYFNQSMMEVTILELLNNNCDPHDEHHILRLRDSFIHKSHLCLVFELLSSNLYELIKQNSFGGLSTQLVKVFTAQLLDALTILKDARLIHCDLKPENILLKSLQSPQIKVIDFGSACHERQTVYTYIQSRFYRSPEVLLGVPYTAAIDMWSLGCIAVELFLGLPLFPGTSEYNQITRIVEMIGMPPPYMLEMGKQSGQFFESFIDGYNQKKWRLKSIEQYSREHKTQEQPGKKYFQATTLPDIIKQAPMPGTRQGKPHEVEKEVNNRAAFIDFCQGLLNLNPIERWTPQQARLHPFITGEKFTGPYVPAGGVPRGAHSTPQSVDPKRPYGGLVQTQPKVQRPYQDAATYGQLLAQHQAYTAQAQVASQPQSGGGGHRNPYLNNADNNDYSPSQQQPPPQQPPPQPPQQQPQYTPQQQQQPSNQQRLMQQNSMANQMSHYSPAIASATSHPGNPNPPANSYYPNQRGRAQTIGNMDNVPPSIARLISMNKLEIPGISRSQLTPVMNRDDPMAQLERRQKQAQPTYPQLEHLQQQAELSTWGQPPSGGGYYQSPQMMEGQDRGGVREAAMSSVRTAARHDPNIGPAAAAALSSPPQAYTGNPAPPTSRYNGGAYQSPPQQPYDAFDHSSSGGEMPLYAPLQPQYQSSYATPPSSQQGAQGGASRHPTGNQPPPAPSFYGSAVVAAGVGANNAQRNPFQVPSNQPSPNPHQAQGNKDARRSGGMDVWAR